VATLRLLNSTPMLLRPRGPGRTRDLRVLEGALAWFSEDPLDQHRLLRYGRA